MNLNLNWCRGISDHLLKHLSRFLLHRYLGQFLNEKVSLEQLSFDLANGTGYMSDVAINVECVNECLENATLPLALVDGYIGRITVKVPWSNLFTSSCSIVIERLELTLQPRPCASADIVPSMFESMMSSMTMTKSIELARSFLSEEQAKDKSGLQPEEPLEGVEIFAHVIDSILTRMEVFFVDSVIRLEHYQEDNSKLGIAVEVRIKRAEYFDERSCSDSDSPVSEPVITQSSKAVSSLSSTKKIIKLSGVELFTDMFSRPDNMLTSMFIRRQGVGSGMNTPNSGLLSEFQSAYSESAMFQSCVGPAVDHFSSSLSSCPVLFAKFSPNQHTITVKLKETEAKDCSASSRRIECELFLGGCYAILCPTQLHLLINLVSALFPENDVSTKSSAANLSKPMQPDDFRRIESQLQKEIHQPNIAHQVWGTSLKQGNWSGEEAFHPVGKHRFPGKVVSYRSGDANDQDTNCLDTAEFTTITFNSSENLHSADSLRSSQKPDSLSKDHIKTTRQRNSSRSIDLVPDVTVCKIRLNFLCCLLLHEDSLSNSSVSLSDAVHQLDEFADAFFNSVSNISVGIGSNLEQLRCTFCAAAPKDHLRFVGSPFVIDFTEQQFGHRDTALNLSVSSTICELTECLVLPSSGSTSDSRNLCQTDTELLCFYPEKAQTEPNLAVHFSSDRGVRNVQLRLTSCKSEIDVSIIDRLYNLINCKPVFLEKSRIDGQFLQASKLFDIPALRDDIFDTVSRACYDGFDVPVDIVANCWSLNIRFPIADVRPVDERLPWWFQNLRPDILELRLDKPSLRFSVTPEFSKRGEAQLIASGVTGLFMKSKGAEPLRFLRAQGRDEMDSCSLTAKWDLKNDPLFSEAGASASNASDDSLSPGGSGVYFKVSNARTGPFSKKTVVHESEQLVMVGDQKELKEFSGQCLANTEISVNIKLPFLRLFLPSKAFYEILYNRLVNDLLMWTPSNPGTKVSQLCSSNQRYSVNVASMKNLCPYQSVVMGGDDEFMPCKSALKQRSVNSLSDSEDEEGSSTNGRSEHNRDSTRKLPNALVLKLEAMDIRTIILMGEPSPGNVPATLSELTMHGSSLELFLVSAYEGNKDVQYFYTTLKRLSVYHASGLTNALHNSEHFDYCKPAFASVENEDISCVLSCTKKGVALNHVSEDNFSVSFKVHKRPKEKTKDFLLTLGLRNSTLHVNKVSSAFSWIQQLINFFDSTDLPVLGYTPPRVITELHFHTWACAIQYKPIGFAAILLCCINSLDLSSNIVAQSNALRLHFIVEELALFLADKSTGSRGELLSDFVAISNMGFFELIVTLLDSDQWDGQSMLKAPAIEISAQNDLLDVRTCADSLSLLIRLLNFSASSESEDVSATSDVPLISKTGKTDASPVPASSVPSKSAKLTKKQSYESVEELNASQTGAGGGGAAALEMSKSIEERISDLVEGAMNDTVVGSSMTPSDDREQTPRTRKNTDEGFCIIDSFAGSGNKGSSGEPRILYNEEKPIKIMSGFFSSSSERSDVLKLVPPDYPVPAIRLQLRDFSVSWHLFGGHDFGLNPIPAKAYSAASIPHPDVRHRFTEARKGLLTAGGPGRDHSVFVQLKLLKICYLHDIYPIGLPQTSRHVLAVQSVEIVDCLCTSRINKLLYQYKTEKKPKQTCQPMVCIKMLSCKPEGDRQKQFAADCYLKVSLLPLRLNVDQDTLEFLQDFCADIASTLATDDKHRDRRSSTSSTSNVVVNVTSSESRNSSNRRCSINSAGELGSQTSLAAHSDKNADLPSPVEDCASSQTIVNPPSFADANVTLIDLEPCQFGVSIKDDRDNAVDLSNASMTMSFYAKESKEDSESSSDENALGQLFGFSDGADATAILTAAARNEDSDSDDEFKLSGSLPSHELIGTEQSVVQQQQELLSIASSSSSESNRPVPRKRSFVSVIPPNVEKTAHAEEEKTEGGTAVSMTPVQAVAMQNIMDLERPIQLELLDELRPPVPVVCLAHTGAALQSGLYFKTFIFAPELVIKLDYHGKRLSMNQGAVQGFLFGISQLHQTELRLKEIHCKQGLLGLNKVVNHALNEWLNDIRRHQMSNIVGGWGPMYCLVQVAHGVRDLFWLPVEEYRKDGHLFKGIVRGTESFTLNSATACLELTQQVVGSVQVGITPSYLAMSAFFWFLIPFWFERLVYKFAYDVVNPNYPPRTSQDPWQAFYQPSDIREGLTMACKTVKQGIVETAVAVSTAAQEERLHGRWAIRGILRQLTPAALRPLVAVTQATGQIIGGLRNQIRPDARRDDIEKWKVTI